MQLELRTQATLDTIGTENYIRYGTAGPKRHVVGVTEPNPIPKSLTVQISLRFADQIETQAVLESLILHRIRHIPEQQTTWGVHDPARGLQLLWMWDFYRMVSLVHLRLCVADVQSSSLFMTLKALQPQAHLILDIRQQAGQVHQEHLLTSAPQITDECS